MQVYFVRKAAFTRIENTDLYEAEYEKVETLEMVIQKWKKQHKDTKSGGNWEI